MRKAAMTVAVLMLAAPALAQQRPPAAAPAPDPAMQAAQAAFEALPEAERKAIQNDLTFATAFSGAAAGSFGPLTFRAIQAFEREAKTTVDGVLDQRERRALAEAAQRARTATRFALRADAASGAVIGVPEALLPKVEPNAAGGTRWQTADGRATLNTRLVGPDEGSLEQLYEKALVSSNRDRKVTYKLLRPDFFVVAGETKEGKFYQRVGRAADGRLRGFSLGYDKASAGVWDRLTVAIANSFEPTPGAAVAAAPTSARPSPASGTPSTGQPLPPGAGTVTTPPTASPVERTLSGLVVATGRVLTAAAALKTCAAPRVGGQPARIDATDEPAGLALLTVEGLRAPAFAPAGGDAAEPVVLARGLRPAGGRGLMAVPAEEIDPATGRFRAAIQPGAAGAPLFGRDGSFAGLVTSDPSARFRVAGVVLAASHRLAMPAAVAAFLSARGIAPGSGAAGGLAARMPSAVEIACGR
jgi:hypothetical protein